MRILTLLIVLTLSACSTNYGGITSTKLEGEAAAATRYASFHVDAVELPAFLGPVIVSNFSVAMAERGYQPVSSDGDMIATVRYVQEDLGVEDGDVRFIARIAVTLRGADTDTVLVNGSIQRLHTIHAGEYMHVGVASISFLQSFRDMISGLPMGPALEE